MGPLACVQFAHMINWILGCFSKQPIHTIQDDIQGQIDCPVLPILLNGHKVNALFDSGSKVTIISDKFASTLKTHSLHSLPLPNWQLSGANLSPLHMLGNYNLFFRIPNSSIQQKFNFVVVKNLQQDVIIGTDLMHQLNISIDHGTKTLRLNKKSPNQSDNWSYDIASHRHLTLKPKMEHLFYIPCDKLRPNRTYLVETSGNLPENLLLQCSVTKTNQQGLLPVIIANTSKHPIKLPRNTQLAKCTGSEYFSAKEIHGDVPDRKPVYVLSPTEIIEKLDLSKVPSAYYEKVKRLVIEYRDVFARDKLDLGHCNVLPHVIRLQDPTKVVNQPPYRWPYALTKAVHDYVDNLLNAGVIRHSTSPFSSPLMMVRKAGADPTAPLHDQYRVVHNFKKVNDNILPCSYPLRNLHELLDHVGSGKVHSLMDLSQGYFQQKVIDPHGATAFSVPGKGLFEYIKSPMGINSSPAYFQRLLDFVCRGIPNCYVYLDDLILSTKDWKEHLTGLEEMFKRLRKYQLKCNIRKVTLGACEVDYLGYNISAKSGIRPGQRKTEAVLACLPPKTKTEIKAFLGLCSFFRKCVPKFAELAAPLNKLVRKDSGYHHGSLPDDSLKAFRNIQHALSSRPCLAPVDFNREFILTVDSSNAAQGAILSQKDENGVEHPCAFASKMLSDPQKRKPAFQREKEAIRWGQNHFKPYLLGKEYLIRTDHRPLVSLAKGTVDVTDSVSADIQNMRPFRVEYLPGNKMPADFLSRCVYAVNYGNKAPHGSKDKDNVPEPLPLLMPAINGTKIPKLDFQAAQKSDNELKALACYYKWKLLPNSNDLRAFVHTMASGFYLDADGIIRDKKNRLYVPTSLRAKLFHLSHDKWGHPGIERMQSGLKDHFTWPNLKQDLENYVRSCHVCAKSKPPHKYNFTPSDPLPTPRYFNDRVHADCLTNLPGDNINNFRAAIVFVDAFSGYVSAHPIRSPSAEEVIRIFTSHWLPAHGAPCSLTTDNGSEFATQAVKKACEDLQIKHTFTSPGHSRSNGAAERAIREINKFFRLYAGGQAGRSRSKWPELLPSWCYIHNSTSNARGFSPFFLQTGVTPRLPWSNLTTGRVQYGDNAWSPVYNSLADAAKIVRHRLNDQRARNNSLDSARHSFQSYQPGDLAYLAASSNATKLERRFGGPYLVLHFKYPHVTLKRLGSLSHPFTVHLDSTRKGHWRHPGLHCLEDDGQQQKAEAVPDSQRQPDSTHVGHRGGGMQAEPIREPPDPVHGPRGTSTPPNGHPGGEHLGPQGQEDPRHLHKADELPLSTTDGEISSSAGEPSDSNNEAVPSQDGPVTRSKSDGGRLCQGPLPPVRRRPRRGAHSGGN